MGGTHGIIAPRDIDRFGEPLLRPVLLLPCFAIGSAHATEDAVDDTEKNTLPPEETPAFTVDDFFPTDPSPTAQGHSNVDALSDLFPVAAAPTKPPASKAAPIAAETASFATGSTSPGDSNHGGLRAQFCF